MTNYKLTITVLTMNRAEQLKNAVYSCIDSVLPEQTQFVIVDNASSDGTEHAVEEIKNNIKYDVVYHREDVNRGVGGGRNICFDLAEGEYVYFLDDDAEIAEESKKDFFIKSIDYLDKNQNVATLTTNIIDKVFGERTVRKAKSLSIDGFPCVYTFQGGSVFARKSSFKSPMFMNIMYGNEEIAISMDAFDRGFHNVLDESVSINHLPMKNKWDDAGREKIIVQGANNILAIKRLQYPVIFIPLLHLAFWKRIQKYNIKNKELLRTFKQERKEFICNNKLRRIHTKTIIKAFIEYGFAVF